MLNYLRCFFICIMMISLSSCSKSGTKEFFFGETGGPNPFSIGTTLEPLDTKFTSHDLPKPQAPLPPHQQPSRAKKAGEILGITSSVSKADDMSHHHKISASKSSVNFVEFDRQMNMVYEDQSSKGYLLDGILGGDKPIDPTTMNESSDTSEN